MRRNTTFAVENQNLMESRPREAAVAIVNYVNHRNANVSLLALSVRWITTSKRGAKLIENSYSTSASRIADIRSTYKSAPKNS